MSRIVIDARESGTTTGRYVDKLIEYLYKLPSDHEFILLAKKHRVDFYKKLAPNYTTVATPYDEFTFGEQLGFLKQIKSLRPDLVFFPMAQQPVWYSGKVVTAMQDLTTIRFRNTAKNWFIFTFKREVYKWVNKRVARKSVHVITPTDFVRHDVASYCHISLDKITVTYEAADLIDEKPVEFAPLHNKKFIMYIGRPMPHKNLPRLVEAFGTLQKKYPDLWLVLAGRKDTLYTNIEESAKKQGITNILFTGYITDGQLSWLYKNTSAYVFPSLSEGFGLPGIEAMIHGAPVISSNATCLPEVYKDGALYFDPLSITDMAEKIALVLDSPKMAKELIAKGSAVGKTYSWQRTAKQTLAVFDDALRDN